MEDQPPVFKTWRSWYWLVMIVLAVQIVGYYLITRAFS
jgi:hypothetical protein